MMRLSKDLIILTFFFQHRYHSNYILNEASNVSFIIEGLKGNVTVVVVIITTLISPVVVPMVSELPVTVPVLSVAVLTASGLM